MLSGDPAMALRARGMDLLDAVACLGGGVAQSGRPGKVKRRLEKKLGER
jgi:hypothetical protein